MRAIVCNEFDSPEKLSVVETDDPVPGDHEVLVRVKATGLGYVDALTVAGLYQIKPPLPFIPGNEISGVVERTGEAVKHLRVGQRVVAMPLQGGLAEQVCLPETGCTVVPDVLSHVSAASFLINYCTAWHGLIQCGNLEADERILILGAAGGVGTAAIDVAKAFGARVTAGASTKKKRDACLAMGADDVIDYRRQNWRDRLTEILDNQPLNLVYDPVGGDYAEPALRSLAPDGRYLVVGFASGEIPKIPLNLVLLKRCSIIGVNWGGFIGRNPGEARPVLNVLLQWIAQGKLNPQPGESYDLEHAGIALANMLTRKSIGKTVIAMDEQQ